MNGFKFFSIFRKKFNVFFFSPFFHLNGASFLANLVIDENKLPYLEINRGNCF